MTTRVMVSAQRSDKTSYDGVEICVLRRDPETGGGAVLHLGARRILGAPRLI